MKAHKFIITIDGEESNAKSKANSIAVLAKYLDEPTLKALAKVVVSEPQKVSLAKQFLGL